MYAARKDGVLEAYYPNLENTVLEAADAALQAWNIFENWSAEQALRRAKQR